VISSSLIRSSANWLAGVLTLLALVYCATGAVSDQAKYFYDELGQLVGVLDGQGDAALYTYDAVGNLLSIDRSTVSASV